MPSLEELKIALQGVLRADELSRAIQDLRSLRRLVPLELARTTYVDPMLRGEAGALAELFAITRAANNATSVEPHAVGRGTRRCDGKLHFGDEVVYIEVKRQRDDFPFNSSGQPVESGVTWHFGSRPGSDPRYLGDRPAETTDPLPGAAIWRGTLEEAAAQLPKGPPTMILVACDAFGDLEEDVTAALYGDAVVVATPHPQGFGSIHRTERLGNGFFGDTRFAHVCGVWFFRLRSAETGPATLVCDWARGAQNPNYTGPGLPQDLTLGTPNVVGDIWRV